MITLHPSLQTPLKKHPTHFHEMDNPANDILLTVRGEASVFCLRPTNTNLSFDVLYYPPPNEAPKHFYENSWGSNPVSRSYENHWDYTARRKIPVFQFSMSLASAYQLTSSSSSRIDLQTLMLDNLISLTLSQLIHNLGPCESHLWIGLRDDDPISQMIRYYVACAAIVEYRKDSFRK